ncbi:hypothetical protein EXIGLDRAFT_757212 [Exidia glandulosa HHB12029]|uniref:Uncharacterized protein n=1 Tax=Exidia glandulosa HHB12029 TaxID=1314781 RepID=A0A166NF18_EXIGL|nr:hypothetical protein EXIGLDRAFT_757212 [Exidia glandulosa HHB12029]
MPNSESGYESDDATPPSVIAAQTYDPDPTVSRSACTGHHNAVIRNAMNKLVSQLSLPDLTTKHGLKRCYWYEDVIASIFDKAKSADGHASIAAAIALCRISTDSGLVQTMEPDDFVTALSSFLQHDKCELLHMAALMLLIRVLAECGEETAEALGEHIVPLVITLLAHQERDNMVTELCAEAIGAWGSVGHWEERLWPEILDSFVETARLSDRVTRQTFSQLLYTLSESLCGFHVRGDPIHVDIENSAALRAFLLASLQSPAAADRLVAMRGLHHLLPRIFRPSWDRGAVSVIPADDPMLVQLHHRTGLDVTTSDAATFCNLSHRFFRSMRKFVADGDALSLANELCDIILEDPLVVEFSPRTVELLGLGELPSDCGLEYENNTWLATLDLCISALEREGAHLLDSLANERLAVMRVYALLRRNDLGAAAELARSRIENDAVSRKFAASALFFCYPLALSRLSRDFSEAWIWIRVFDEEGEESNDEAFAACIKTPLYRAILSTLASSTMDKLLNYPFDCSAQSWIVYSLFGRIAKGCARRYLETAPFDGRDTNYMIDIDDVCMILFHGSSTIRKHLQTALKQFEITKAIDEKSWKRMRRSPLEHLVRELYTGYAGAAKAWAPKLSRHFRFTPREIPEDQVEQLWNRGDVHALKRESTAAQVDTWRALFRGERNGRYARVVSWSDAPPELLATMLLLDYPEVATHTCAWCRAESVPANGFATATATARRRTGMHLISGSVYEIICDGRATPI